MAANDIKDHTGVPVKCNHDGCEELLPTWKDEYYTHLGSGPYCEKHYEYWQGSEDRAIRESEL